MNIKGNILDRSFYTRLDARVVARELLGKILVTGFDHEMAAGMIVETEAYMGPEDLACHAHSNRITPRNKVMYSTGGIAYVYICYGMHHLFNAVTGTEGMGHAVLVRALEPAFNEGLMMDRRGIKKIHPGLLNGPGKLSAALNITKDASGSDLTSADNVIRIMDNGVTINSEDIDAGPRVGMSPHTKHCGHFPWRFKIRNNKWTSKPDQVEYNW